MWVEAKGYQEGHFVSGTLGSKRFQDLSSAAMSREVGAHGNAGAKSCAQSVAHTHIKVPSSSELSTLEPLAEGTRD